MVTIRQYHNIKKRVDGLREISFKLKKKYFKRGTKFEDYDLWRLDYELQQLQIQIKKLGEN